MDLTTASTKWPALREELRLHEGPADANGQPNWTVQDPVRHRFLRIDWVTWEVLRRWWMGDPALIADEINRHTTLAVDAADVVEVLGLARREQLVEATQAPATGPKGLRGLLTWLLHNYLFFRVPLVRPDRWLAQWLPATRWLGSPTFFAVTAVALVAGLFGVLQQTERLQSQWLDMLSWRGILLYGMTICLVKVAHELGHAWVAKHHGCRVPTIGVAFMVLWPVAYTDTTEVWRLKDKKARIRVAAAGVRVELTIAAWATLAWTLLPQGPLGTAAFVLATMTWISSVLINLSPFMRFDGYFLLCDVLDLPNLHERSFAQARSWLRRTLLGWQQAPAETFSPPVTGALIGFALATWAWRLALYLGIAWTVYAFGFKLLGIALLLVELGWFIAAPLWRELRIWRSGFGDWKGSRRATVSATVLALLLLLSFVPWRSTVTGAALVQPAQTLAVRLPTVAMIDEIGVTPGSRVTAGQVLLRATTPELTRQAASAQNQIKRLQQEVSAASMGGEQQAQWSSLQADLLTARDQLQAVQESISRLQPVAPFDAVVVDLLAGLQSGMQSPPPQQVLMHLASVGKWTAVAYVDEATARALTPGQEVQIGLDAQPAHRLAGRVEGISAQPTTVVSETALVQAHGGLIDAREASGGWVPSKSLYRVALAVEESPTLGPRSWRGHVVLRGEALGVAPRAWRALSALWVREAGF